MKKAIVFYLYGTRNAGDMAICVGAIELLKSKGYHITMVSRFSEMEEEYQTSRDYIEEYYPDVKVYPGPFSFERNFSKVKKLKAYIKSYFIISGILPDKKIRQLIQESDVVFFNGGNLLRGSSMVDYLRLMALFYPINLAYKMRKPLYCLPQSTAKISSVGKILLGKYMKCFNEIFVRESISYKVLNEMFPKLPISLSTDLAFFCRDTQKAKDKFEKNFKLSDKKKIALVFRNTGIGDIGKINSEKENVLVEKIKSFMCSNKQYDYYLVVQTNKDRDISMRVKNQLRNWRDLTIIESHDPLILRELYKHMECTITMRLHAGILSLSVLTPVYGLFSETWGLKNPGIMSDYEMPYCIVEYEKKEIKLMQKNEERSMNIREKINSYVKYLTFKIGEF